MPDPGALRGSDGCQRPYSLGCDGRGSGSRSGSRLASRSGVASKGRGRDPLHLVVLHGPVLPCSGSHPPSPQVDRRDRSPPPTEPTISERRVDGALADTGVAPISATPNVPSAIDAGIVIPRPDNLHEPAPYKPGKRPEHLTEIGPTQPSEPVLAIDRTRRPDREGRRGKGGTAGLNAPPGPSSRLSAPAPGSPHDPRPGMLALFVSASARKSPPVAPKTHSPTFPKKAHRLAPSPNGERVFELTHSKLPRRRTLAPPQSSTET